VITWMTHPSFGKTARDLPNEILKQQMMQVCITFDILTGLDDKSEYTDHPAVKMWHGYEFALGIYGMMLGMEFTFNRGYAEATEFWYLSKAIREIKRTEEGFVYDPPPWMFDTDILLSHRSNLARRHPVAFRSKWKNCPKDWPYLWPVLDGGGEYDLFLSRADKKRLKSKQRKLPDRLLGEEGVVNWP
jgi:hypothetical protein